MRNKAMRMIGFIVLLMFFIFILTNIFEFKYGDGIYGMKKFYELEDDSVDVLILGSSHAFESFNTSVLWDEYGIAAFNLCGSMQPLWNTYYYLEEALKTQTPKMIILEGYMLTYESDYSDDSRIIKNTYGLKWSNTKWRALQDSVPKERFWEFAIGYSQFHGRYSEISKEDFLKNRGSALLTNFKGFGCNMETTAFSRPQIDAVVSEEKIPLKSRTYFIKILELAQSKGIPIIVAISPYAGITEKDQAIYNSALKIATNMGVNFYNFNLYYDILELNFETDFADDHHLNYLGNRKLTFFVGAVLKKFYPDTYVDRREQEGYESWAADSAFNRRILLNDQIAKAQTAGEIFSMTQDDYYYVILGVNYIGTYADSVFDYLDYMGITIDRQEGVWVIQNCNIKESLTDYDKTINLSINRWTDLAINMKPYQNRAMGNVLFNNMNFANEHYEINVIVYDKISESVICAKSF